MSEQNEVKPLSGVIEFDGEVLHVAWLNLRKGVRVSHKDVPALTQALARASATPDAGGASGCGTADLLRARKREL